MERRAIVEGMILDVHLSLECVAPGFNIRARWRANGGPWRDFDKMGFQGQLHLAQIIQKWAEVHLR